MLLKSSEYHAQTKPTSRHHQDNYNRNTSWSKHNVLVQQSLRFPLNANVRRKNTLLIYIGVCKSLSTIRKYHSYLLIISVIRPPWTDVQGACLSKFSLIAYEWLIWSQISQNYNNNLYGSSQHKPAYSQPRVQPGYTHVSHLVCPSFNFM